MDALQDLFTRILPNTSKREGFAFLIHPRDMSDVYIKYPFLKRFPDKIISKLLTFFWPITVSEVVYKNQVKGWIISCPLTAEQMMKGRKLAKKSIIQAAKLAEKKGASIIGLGALTASFSRGGLDLKPHIKAKITTGRLYTAKIVTDTTVDILSVLKVEKEKVEISIVGAAGSIGSACAQILAKRGFRKFNLVDLSSKSARINSTIQYMNKVGNSIQITQSESLESIKNSDVIIAATNKPDALITSSHLKQGAVVIDDAQPSDVSPHIIQNRRDVLVLEGGVVHTKEVSHNASFGLKHKGDIFSCLAEVIILACSKNADELYSIGEIVEVDFAVLANLEKRSLELGFKRGEFQNFSKVYSKNDIEHVKDIIHRQYTDT